MIKELIRMKVKDIVPYENNPRSNKKAIDAVAKSIKQVSYANPIIVNEDNVILAGHTRVEALKKLGIAEVDVLKVNGLTEEQERKFRLLDNKAGEFSQWDFVALSEEIEGLNWGDLDLDWGLDEKSNKGDKNGDDENGEEESVEEDDFEFECPECGYRFNE